jgi:hypothetical protein
MTSFNGSWTNFVQMVSHCLDALSTPDCAQPLVDDIQLLDTFQKVIHEASDRLGQI